MNVFQSNLKGIFVDDCSRYLASRLFRKFKGKGVGKIWLNDGVDGSDNVSGSDDDVVVSVEISIGSFTKFGSTCVNECVVQYGSRAVRLGGVTSRICSDVGVEPKYSEGILEVLRCERSGGVSGNVLFGFSGVIGVGDWGMSK